MVRFTTPVLAVLLAAVALALSIAVSAWWLLAALPLAAVAAVGVLDVVQVRHSILRNYPVLGHFRFLLEALRPELQQYFIERNTDGRPFDRDARSLVYERAKGDNQEKAFGTELDVYAVGQEFLAHSIAPVSPPDEPHRVTVGGPQCAKPYRMALLNVSAMSFGALSANAILALNAGAKLGGFAHDTGEGGLSGYHLRPGGDLVWEIGSGYFGCRTAAGGFDPGLFTDKAGDPRVKCVSVKLSQGAKPGIGGVMPAAKMTPEIAAARGVPAHEKCVSPPGHSAFAGPVGLLEFVARLREASGGKPTGFKLCVGRPAEFLSVCKAMLSTGIKPDFIIVDGSEGGTGAAPLEFEDHMGMPLTDGLMFVHQALVGCGLRDDIRVAASGKIASGADIVKRLIQGADYTNAARAMMMALGCIQAQRCHTNTCPVGVTTQDPRRYRALVVDDKAQRVYRFQRETVKSANALIAAMGLTSPEQLRAEDLVRRTDDQTLRRFDESGHRLHDGELLYEPPRWWAHYWQQASADRYG
ncbi:FMN-binding glutamate synthase family protein [Stackebrandtia nassauensis]|uniref:Glutamate synthase (NADPH) n=1 Tax=Stackebrandtia nassauensis (strain DSM 44728 / CIP 108903 / NRRL B-16338 / NBRC 102104 / LLR-40K-21) TaxID=446470 RepID=D3Q894_STANL|nr:FMN-binding glutamate synthase family protein [Stackebrandtia nassauensis]ADD42468.1 Glutamate synthase (NADPH) [Stackebrandtia nassauensis DSM 44728]